MSDVAVTQIVSFLVGVISSLAAAGIIASFSPSFRFWCRKNYRIVKTSIRNAKITRFVNSSNSIGDRTLNVGIILNGTSPYLVDMEEAFIHEAKNLLGNKGILIHVERSQGTHNSNKARNSKVINELFSKFSNSKPDIVVTFGSGVSTYIRKYHKDIPQIFVGVTDPIASELCNSLDSDTARGDVCGVTFSITAVDRIEFLKTVFPHKRIGFVYNPKYLADIHHLKNFREEMIKNNWNFTEISIDKPQIQSSVFETVDVLIGWLFFHENIATFISSCNKPIVGGGWVDLRKGACCCIADDEEEIGKIASHILYDYIVNQVSLCQMPIQMPKSAKSRLNIGFNFDAAARYNISFSQEIISSAKFLIKENKN